MLFKSKKQYIVYTAGADILKKKAKPIKTITAEIEDLGL